MIALQLSDHVLQETRTRTVDSFLVMWKGGKEGQELWKKIEIKRNLIINYLWNLVFTQAKWDDTICIVDLN